ncbi:hypothetical protein [Saccharibacillus qingshengii]|uniref:hypothetical protein n=1 Tax=Saccharibacillus qingshengii TaxID=1763540 RepID=UPI001553B0C5|nr:hypothetical protein [Saccharibacillus qingshengii]
MKTYTRAASLLGVLLLSGALAACGSESEPAAQTEPAGTAATSGQEGIEEPATAPADEAAADDKEGDKTAAADTKEEAASGDKASADTAADGKTAAGDSADDKKPEAAAPGSADSKNTDSKGGASSDAGAAAADIKPADKAKQGKKGAGADRPKTESFEVAGASSTDSVTGSLQEGYGYAFYAMKGLKFDAEKNLLTMADNPDYYATITPLAKGYGLAGLRKEGQTALKDYGKAAELKGANIPAALSASRLFMSAEGDNGTGQFGLWETQNKGYQVEIHMPSGTESETFGPLVYASISTLAD